MKFCAKISNVKVVGNKADKTISITFLVDAKDPNIKMHISNLSLIDLEGNEVYRVEYQETGAILVEKTELQKYYSKY